VVVISSRHCEPVPPVIARNKAIQVHLSDSGLLRRLAMTNAIPVIARYEAIQVQTRTYRLLRRLSMTWKQSSSLRGTKQSSSKSGLPDCFAGSQWRETRFVIVRDEVIQ